MGRALPIQTERQEASTQGCMLRGVVGQMANVITPASKLSTCPGALRSARPALQLAPVQNLMNHIRTAEPNRYSASMRWLHWLRAGVVLGTLAIGVVMVNLPDELQIKFDVLYPNHKQLGLLALLLVAVALIVRVGSRVPRPHAGLAPWERALSKFVYCTLLLLLVAVPLMGYSMSSTFTQSDGVPFFFFGHVPELLPKNDQWFERFQLLHRISAYTLLGLLVLHIGGAIKHRFIDKDAQSDVLRRML